MKIFQFLLLLPLLASCSAKWHLKKAVQKDPSILTEGVTMIEIQDTIIIELPETTSKTIHKWTGERLTETKTDSTTGAQVSVSFDPIDSSIAVEVVQPKKSFSKPYTFSQTVLRPQIRGGPFHRFIQGLIGFFIGAGAMALVMVSRSK